MQIEKQGKIRKALRGARFRVAFPFLSYEFTLDDLVDSKSADERLAKLDAIQDDLKAAVVAVGELRSEAEMRRAEAEGLKSLVSQLEEERATAEKMLKLPEDALTSLLSRAGSKGRHRGVVEGLIIGLLTGSASSWLVWYFTR